MCVNVSGRKVWKRLFYHRMGSPSDIDTVGGSLLLEEEMSKWDT